MQLIAKGVWQLTGFPRHFINVYLVEDVLIDAGTRWARRRIARQLRDRPLRLARALRRGLVLRRSQRRRVLAAKTRRRGMRNPARVRRRRLHRHRRRFDRAIGGRRQARRHRR